MTKAEKWRIIAIHNGTPIGYVKSISYKNGTYTLTQDKSFARTYAKQETIMSDIDTIAYHGQQRGVVFIMG